MARKLEQLPIEEKPIGKGDPITELMDQGDHIAHILRKYLADSIMPPKYVINQAIDDWNHVIAEIEADSK